MTKAQKAQVAWTLSAMIVLPWLLISCNNSTGEIVRLVSERDSLRQENSLQERRLKRIDMMLSTLNNAVDSIANEEGLLFVNVDSEIPINRNDALKNVERFEQVVKHQHERIRKLELQLSADDVIEDDKSTGLLALMKSQLAEKDRQISYLKNELSKKNVDIERLRRQVSEQTLQIDEQSRVIADLGRRNAAQSAALTRQDEYINSCYVLIGTRSDLERKGVVRKKKLVPDGALDKTKFAKVDIRKWKEISFHAKRPHIMTNMPQSSFTLTTDGMGYYTLTILNPTSFWSISNYLVIQTD